MVGGVTGVFNGTIKNCYNTGNVSGKYCYGYCGGIAVGSSSVSIQNCYNTGDVTMSDLGTNCIAGICGGSSTSVTNCHNSGNVTENYNYGYEYSGEIVPGNVETAITGCTYLHRTSNNFAHGATEVTTSDNSFSNAMTALLNEMNTAVNQNNSNASSVKLKTWVLGSDGYPVWSNN